MRIARETPRAVSCRTEHPAGDPAAVAQIKASLNEIEARLNAQDTRLHEIAEVAFWFRRALRPLRAMWRGLEPVRRLFRRPPAQF